MIKTELVETKRISRPKGTYTEFEQLQWVANKPLPAVGSEVEVKINGIGRSTVLKYFVEHGFIGLVVQPQNPPDWYKNKTSPLWIPPFMIDACHVSLRKFLNFKFVTMKAKRMRYFTKKHYKQYKKGY